MQKPNQSIAQWVASLFGANTNKALSENLSAEAYNEVVQAVGKLQPVAEESTEDAPEDAPENADASNATTPAPVQKVEALTARITALEQSLSAEQSAKAELQTKFDALSAEYETTKQNLTATQTINAQLRQSVNPVAEGDLASQKVTSKRTRAEEEALERRRKKQQ